VQTASDLKSDALAEAIRCALTGVYEATQPPERVWERIAGRAARLGRATGRGRYRRIEPSDSTVGLEPQMGPARVSPQGR
jgi:hypothetical protein